LALEAPVQVINLWKWYQLRSLLDDVMLERNTIDCLNSQFLKRINTSNYVSLIVDLVWIGFFLADCFFIIRNSYMFFH
jgi:hypothetical protein